LEQVVTSFVAGDFERILVSSLQSAANPELMDTNWARIAKATIDTWWFMGFNPG
jgi:hypothetical protein